jgi:hypothetical protein
MKGLSVMLVLPFLCSCLAQESPLSVVKKLEVMPDELVSYAKGLMKKDVEPTDEMLEKKVYSMLEASFSGSALLVAKQNVREGLSKGWPLANTDDFYWAFPMPSPLFGSARVLSSDDSSAVIEYDGGVMDTYIVLEEEAPLAELVSCQEQEYLTGIDAGDQVLHAKADYRATIRLAKTSVGWRIVDFKEFFSNKMVVSEG